MVRIGTETHVLDGTVEIRLVLLRNPGHLTHDGRLGIRIQSLLIENRSDEGDTTGRYGQCRGSDEPSGLLMPELFAKNGGRNKIDVDGCEPDALHRKAIGRCHADIVLGKGRRFTSGH